MIIKCPKCRKEMVKGYVKNNRWVSWIEGDCFNCGYRYFLKDSNYEFLQPSHPAFKEIYKKDPFAESEKRKKELSQENEQRRILLEKKYFEQKKSGKLKSWEEKVIRKEVLN